MPRAEQSQVSTTTATIASSASLSGEVDLNGFRLAAIEFPATITGMTAVQIQAASSSGGTFKDVTDKDDSTTNIQLTATASKIMPVDMTETHFLRYIKIESTDGAGVAANVSQETVLTLHLTRVV
jgi:hypothetical protein